MFIYNIFIINLKCNRKSLKISLDIDLCVTVVTRNS